MGRFRSMGLAAIFLFTAAGVSAQWQLDIQSKTVYPGRINVSVGFTLHAPLDLAETSVPIVVRELNPGAFWTGSLPYDTTDADGNHYVNRVVWHPSVPPFAYMILELRPGPGCENSGPYDGASPDHFVINIHDGPPCSRYPDGLTFVTIRFDVTDVLGQFELDSACFSGSLNKIMVIDNHSIDRGPSPGTNELVFTKGVITIAPCECGIWSDVNADRTINPVDAVIIVNYVYKGVDARVFPPNCPYEPGDVNCDGRVNPVDNVWLTQRIYTGRQLFPLCAPCEQ